MDDEFQNVSGVKDTKNMTDEADKDAENDLESKSFAPLDPKTGGTSRSKQTSLVA